MPKSPKKTKKQDFNCAVTTCLYRGDLTGLCQFPECPEKSQKWAEALGLEKWKKKTYVCHAHFSKDDFFFFENGKTRLRPNRTPKVKHPVSFFILFFP